MSNELSAARIRALKDAVWAECEAFECTDDEARRMLSAIDSVKCVAPPAADSTPAAGVPFQARVQPWMFECFGAEIAADKDERNHRFYEEATEAVQANGMTRSEAHQLVDYTYDRPIGELKQEVGGVMVTLAAMCLASGIDMHAAGETELARIWTKVEQIRAKQAAKPKHSPLPAAPASAQPPVESATVLPHPDTTYSAPWAGHTFKYHSADQIVEYANARVLAASAQPPVALIGQPADSTPAAGVPMPYPKRLAHESDESLAWRVDSWNEQNNAPASAPAAMPAAIVDENDEGKWADILPDADVKAGQHLFAAAAKDDLGWFVHNRATHTLEAAAAAGRTPAALAYAASQKAFLGLERICRAHGYDYQCVIHDWLEQALSAASPALLAKQPPVAVLTNHERIELYELRGTVEIVSISPTEIRRIASELRAYNPAADEYKGEHIHKVWARELIALLSTGEAQS